MESKDELINKIVDETLKKMGDEFADNVWKRLMKERKEEPKKYPEGILAFKNADRWQPYYFKDMGFDYYFWVEQHLKFGSTIHSVKNKAGEVFTIGDNVYPIGNTDKSDRIIKRFDIVSTLAISNPDSWIEARYDNNNFSRIDDLTKVEKQPLWKTFDGVEILKEDEEIWLVSDGALTPPFKTQAPIEHPFTGIDNHFKYFKHKSNAEKYAAENKKSISYKDLQEYIKSPKAYSNALGYLSLEKLLENFKPK